MNKADIEKQTQEFRDYVTTLLSLFIFSAGIGLRSINDNIMPYSCTLIFVISVMVYITLRYGVKGLNQKRKLVQTEGLVSHEVYEKIKEYNGEIYIVERFEKIDYIRFFIFFVSLMFLITSINSPTLIRPPAVKSKKSRER